MSASTLSESWRAERARYASLTRSRPADDPELLATRRNLRAARLANHLQTELAKAPEITSEQRRELAAILVGGRK